MEETAKLMCDNDLKSAMKRFHIFLGLCPTGSYDLACFAPKLNLRVNTAN